MTYPLASELTERGSMLLGIRLATGCLGAPGLPIGWVYRGSGGHQPRSVNSLADDLDRGQGGGGVSANDGSRELTWTELQGRQIEVCECGHYRFVHDNLTGACAAGRESRVSTARCRCSEFRAEASAP